MIKVTAKNGGSQTTIESEGATTIAELATEVGAIFGTNLDGQVAFVDNVQVETESELQAAVADGAEEAQVEFRKPGGKLG